jgi:two-component system, NtrC family, sensor kinase
MSDNSAQARRVLVVDDTESIHADFRAILVDSRASSTTLDEAEAAIFGNPPEGETPTQKTCYHLDSAFQGQEGLEMVRQSLAEEHPYQLAFVDMRMPPGWDGLKTIEEIWNVDPDIQVVICTAHSDYSWEEIVQRLGYSDRLLILKKPFDTVEAEQLAGALTEKWALERQAATMMAELEQLVSDRTQEFEQANALLKKEIADRRQTEETLRENEQKFRSFVENASDIIFCLSADGIFTYVSPNWTSILGHDVSEVLGQPMAQFLPDNAAEKCRQVLGQVIATGREKEGMEYQLEHKDGSWRWHTVSVSPLKNAQGNVTALVGIAHDITRRKSGQEELQRAKQELQQILSASTPLCVVSKDYDIVMLNDTFCSLFAVGVDAMAGKKCHDIMCTSKCHTSECPVRNISSDGERYCYEVAIDDGTDEEMVCMATATPYFNPDYSDVTGVVISFMDITERKKGEKVIAAANTKLEQANRELKDMQSQVIQNEKLASIGQLAAGVAHEMNTPVGFVASNFQTLQSYMSKFLKLVTIYEDLAQAVEVGDKDARLERIDEINALRKRMKIDFIMGDLEELFSESKEGLERVTEIIQNLRDFSRVDQAEVCSEYDLKEGLKTTLTVARNELKYDVDMHLDLNEVPLVACHSGQVNQVFLNILVNAAQAIKSQEREEKGSIRVRTYATETHVVCEITDDGPGIPPDVLSKVFDPFFTTKPPGKGTGLGLSVSYDIVVNKHKGELVVDS